MLKLSKQTNITKQSSKFKNYCETWKSNTGPLARQSEQLRLDHRDM